MARSAQTLVDSIKVCRSRVVRYGVVFLPGPALYNRRMRTLPAGVAVAMLVAGCGSGGDPDAEIRALLAEAEQAAEARDASFFGGLVGESYRDSRGRDRAELMRSVRGYFIANQRIEVVTRVDEVELQGADAARVVLHAGMLGQRSGAATLMGVDADLYRFELELVNEDGDWRIIGADWSRGMGE